MASTFVAANLAPAAVGQALNDVDTPACIVDLDAVEANIRTAIEMVTKASPAVRLRPHVKSHKCAELALLQTEIAREQMIGVCCQKVVEAEAMLAAGIRNILVSNQIVGPSKLARLAALTSVPGATIGVLVDDADNLRDISSAMARACAEAGDCSTGAALDIYVEVDVGQRRCGVSTTAEVLHLAQLAASLPGTRFAGIQCYQGAAQHIRTVAARGDVIAGVAARAAEVRDALAAAGVPCPVVTGGGSGTFWMEAASGVFTEVQPGSFIFNDADYARNLDAAGQETWVSPWVPSLFLLSTVMSRHAPAPSPAPAPASGTPGSAAGSAGAGAGSSAAADGGWVVLDSGLKAQSTDSGLPVVVCDATEYRLRDRGESHAAGITVAALSGVLPLRTVAASVQQGVFDSSVGHLLVKGVSDEHSTLVPRAPPASASAPVGAAPASSPHLPALGSKLMLMPGHCDPFVNHYDWVVAVRGSKGGAVVGVWRLGSRSPGS
jgi:D-serine deaminase-like pyridoxal phosphate-dependent protein